MLRGALHKHIERSREENAVIAHCKMKPSFRFIRQKFWFLRPCNYHQCYQSFLSNNINIKMYVKILINAVQKIRIFVASYATRLTNYSEKWFTFSIIVNCKVQLVCRRQVLWRTLLLSPYHTRVQRLFCGKLCVWRNESFWYTDKEKPTLPVRWEIKSLTRRQQQRELRRKRNYLMGSCRN
jgi:hypothetical protein